MSDGVIYVTPEEWKIIKKDKRVIPTKKKKKSKKK
jgi:hypothetical protein